MRIVTRLAISVLVLPLALFAQEVAELPINGRTPIMAEALSLGVIGYGQPGLVHPFDAQAAGWSVGGAYSQTSEMLVNGSPNATWDGRLAYSPPQGANGFHGSAWEFNQLRFEAFNVLNHPVFPAPNTTASNSLFGTISGAQANRPRILQIGARFVF